MHSMTGYGASQKKNRQLDLEVYVKSVNGRFLEVRFHLPKEYAPFETEWRKAFQEWTRGTVDVYVHRRLGSDARLKSVSIRHDQARHWAEELRKLQKSLNLKSEISVRDILQMPLVMEHHERQALLPGELKLVGSQLRVAVKKCREARAREGQVLKKELLSLLKQLEGKVADMERWREEAMKSSHQRLKTKLTALQAEQMDASRLALETALLLDKMDVHEEVVRLKEHIKACRSLLQGHQAKGKKLDFYGQELLREVNTIGSKSQLASLTQAVVESKAIIEKIREQVQNIE